MPYLASELKHKLREVKQLEIQLRFRGNKPAAQGKLIWEDFFSLKENETARYHLADLVGIERERFKEILDEYFYFVYFRIYQERGMLFDSLFDPNLLALLGLSPFATEVEIKKRFRELAKKYHPDTGGDSESFITLMSVYERLIGE